MISHYNKLPPILKFLINALLLYLAWYLIYELWLHPLRFVDLWVIDNIISTSKIFLILLGFEVIPEVYDASFRTIGVDGTHGVWIGDSCNGLTIFALFTGFIVAYPGSIKLKLLYIPFGILTIHLLNIIRVTALSIILLYAPEKLDFNHSYTFTTIMYAYIFLLWYWWASKLSSLKK
jgi:exosortase family protein XrtF